MRLRAVLRIVAVGIAAAFAGAFAAAEEKPKAEIVPQLGHSDLVWSVAIAPDGKTALSGSNDYTLRLWDLATGREIRTFKGHSRMVHSVAFSPDGKTALSGSEDNTLRLWDLATGREIRKFEGHSARVDSVAFSPDGKAALSGSADQTLRLWDLATGREVRKFGGDAGLVVSVAIAPDGKAALSGSHDRMLRLWDLATGREIRRFEGHADEVHSVTFSPDGRAALSGSLDKTLRLWDLTTGHELRTFETHAQVYSVAISPDGKTALSGSGIDPWISLASAFYGQGGGQPLPGVLVAGPATGREGLGTGNAATLWDLATGREIRKFERHGSGVSSVAFSPDGKAILSSSDNGMSLWDLAMGREIRKFERYSSVVGSVAFSPDGKTALSGSDDNTLRFWDLATGREIRKFEGHSARVISVAFSPDGKAALSGSADHTIRLWALATGREIGKFSWSGRSLAISPDGKAALTTNEDTLKLWDLTSGREIRTFKGHSHWVESVAFSPDGKTALSGSWDNTVRLWDLATGRELRKLEGHSSLVTLVAIAPDGKTVLSRSEGSGGLLGNDNTVRLWDLATGRELHKLEGHSSLVRSVAFSPDGKTALSGGDNKPRLWDLATGREIRKFEGHSSGVTSVAFSPDGKTALSASNDGTVRLWDLQRSEALASLMASPDGEQLAITPMGIFTASRRDTNMLAIVRGLEVTTIGQVHQSLFNPDLVREALAGDPNHEVEDAAKVINLDKVLDAGPPPAVAITSQEPGSRSGKDLITVAARIANRGKGIGRIEWRINGVTAGVTGAPQGPGPDYDVSQELALDPGENRIEVIAFEGHNLLASLPAQTTIVYDGPADKTKAKLFVLAIGINKYVDQGGEHGHFPPLTGSVPDAQAFSAEMEKAGAGQYEKVRVTLALDEDATLSKLDEAVTKIAGEISPRDTFVLYAAAHGFSLGGNYYMIPQDYQGGGNPKALKVRAIGQERIQEWLAKRIKAKRAVILLDTCQSGALTGGYAKSRTEGRVSEAAVGRLHEATGRPVLTAASPGKSAYENYKGHGVFTYALIEALHKGDANNNGKIEVSELAAHVERRVPELFAELKQNGWVVKGLAATRGAGGDAQTAHFGSTGEDFSLVERLP